MTQINRVVLPMFQLPRANKDCKYCRTREGKSWDGEIYTDYSCTGGCMIKKKDIMNEVLSIPEEVIPQPVPVEPVGAEYFHMAGLKYSPEVFRELAAKVNEKINVLSELKGGEYASNGDRLQNFRKASADMELPMETIWRIYAGKHWDAICTYEKDLRTGVTRERLESIKGRFMDLIVYAILGIAMVEERENLAGKDITPL